MANEEVESPMVEQPPSEQVLEKKDEEPGVSNEKQPRKSKAVAHPPYFQMIKEALLALNDKGGSSPYAIAKYMEEKHKSMLPVNFRKTLALQLKNLAAKGKVVKIRASYKLIETRKMTRSAMNTRATRQKKIEQETKTRKSTRSSSSSSSAKAKTISLNKPMAAKKKRSAAKPRQPKSIKASAAKKAVEASAS